MIAAVTHPDRRTVPILVVAVPLLGALIALRPTFPFAVLALVLILAMAKMPPVPHLVLLLGVTAIVPFALLNRYGIPITALLPLSPSTHIGGGGTGSPGLIVTDALLLVGLVRVVPVILRSRPDPRLRLVAGLIAAFVGVAALQVVRSFLLGRDLSVVGTEFRVLLGFSTCLLALPIVSDPRQRAKLLKGFLVLGLVVGVWGIGQRVFQLSVSGAGDAGLREGVRFTTAGVGQIQGGLFAFPVALLLAFAALVSGQVRSGKVRMLLVAVVILNGVSMLLTYERTFWVVTTLAGGLVFARASGRQRLRAVSWAVIVVLISLVALTLFAPRELTAARERLLSLSQYASDSSVRYRLTESRHVLDEIVERPALGSGFGASIFWGRPWALVPPSSSTFIHNGYLWLAWKVGIPAALLLLVPLVMAVVWRSRSRDDPLFDAVRNGSQGALLALLLASVTFPSFNQLGITPIMGVLVAVCAAGPAPSTEGREADVALAAAGTSRSH